MSQRVSSMMFRKSPIVLCFFGGLLAITSGLACRSESKVPDSEPVGSSSAVLSEGPTLAALKVGREVYTSSQACQECHQGEYSTWHDSYHRTMTQWASAETIVAPFEGVLESRGRRYELERRGDEFWVNMIDPDLDRMVTRNGNDPGTIETLPLKSYKVELVTGSHLAQTFWVETRTGMQHMPWMYHISEDTWIPNADSFLLPPSDTRLFNCWNANCAKCHTVAPEPGFDENHYATQVAELGIACEACHGPGEPHIAFQRNKGKPDAMGRVAVKDPIVNPAKLDHKLGSQICAQCHSAHLEKDLNGWMVEGSKYLPGDDLEEYVTMHRHGSAETDAVYDTGYWNDGTVRTGGDEYLGMVTSACFERGDMSCLSCHSLHDYASTTDQLRADVSGNDSCLQCHESMREELAAHTHHQPGSAGSQCVNCHMPHVVYALFKGIRSHRIDSPNAAVTAATGRPNACNLCHADQTLAWTGEHLHEWYDQPLPELNESQRAVASAPLMALTGDAAQRVISAWHLGWEDSVAASGDDWQVPYLLPLLDDPYSMVRYVGYLSLKRLPGYEEVDYDFLADPEMRQQAIAVIREQWDSASADRATRPAVLIDSQGVLEAETFEALRQQRDDRRIVIPE